jgi:hypothetical protein
MEQFLYDFIHSQYFGFLLIVWVVIDIIWIGRWRDLIGRIEKLIKKPWIFAKDANPEEPPLYPREFLEQLAQNSKAPSKRSDESKKEEQPTTFMKALRVQVFDINKPLRSFGHVLFLAFFVFFLLADAISVANTLVVLNVISDELPPILQRFDLAVLGGALLSAIVGVWMFVEISGDQSDFINTGNLSVSQKGIIKSISLLVAVFSVIVMVAFAIDRLIGIGELQSDPTVNILLSAILFGLVPINSALAAAISFPEGARGAIVVIYLLADVIKTILPILAFLVDIVWRLAYVILDLLIWALFTPLIIIPYGVIYLLRMAIGSSPTPEPQEDK